jgi:hypothetical protein
MIASRYRAQRYPELADPCPRCSAKPEHECHDDAGNILAEPHLLRLDAYLHDRQGRRLLP